MELSERAWVAMISEGPVSAPVLGQPLRFGIQITDAGKQPATDLAYATSASVIVPPPSNDFSFLQLPPNTTCEGLKPADGGGVAVPNAITIWSTDTGRGTRPVFISDDMMQGRSYVAVQSCIAYRTFNKVHHTAACYVFQIHPNAAPAPADGKVSPGGAVAYQLSASTCPTGHSAD